MKKAIIFLLILTSCATIKEVQVNEPYSRVYENLNGNQSQLFVKANDWMVKTFNNASSVIQYSDKTEGVIIGKYLLSNQLTVNEYGTFDNRVYAKLNIQIKDGKAKLTVQILNSWKYDDSGFTIYNYSPEQAKRDVEALSESLKVSLNSNNDNW